jgi:LysM repeat protein
MFVGNIDGGGASGGYPHCGTTANTSLIFPDPGGSVDQFNTNELSVRVGPTGQCTVSGTLTNYGSVGVQQTALRSNDSPSTSAAITVGTAPSVPIVGSTSAAPVSTSPPNIVSDTELGCTKNYTVQAGDTCASIANANSITVAQFLEWNSLINPGCTNIQLNTAYCIAGTDSGGTAATSAQNTATSTSSTIPGAATGCNKWYRVQPGDTCASIANANSITTEQILAWNSKINPGCTNILLNGTYCIAGTNSGGTNNAGTTAQATSALNTAIGVASTATTSPSSYATTVTSSEPVTASATEAPVVIVTVYKTVNPTNSATSAPDTTSTIISTTSSTISTSTGLSLANSASAVLGGGQESSSNSTPVGTGSETVQTGTCTANGNWNCIGGSRYQRCASGSWSTLQPVADGTACQPGQGQDLVYVANPAQPNREYNPPDLPDPYKHIPTPTPTPTLPPPPPTSTPASPLSPPSGSGSFLADTACTIEGQWNCIEGSSFQQCGSGFWSTTQSVAPGTICQPVGQSKDFTIKPAKPKRQTGLYNEGQSGTHKSAPNSKQTGSCPPAQEGLWNCIGGSSFQQCASGAWSDPQFVASGTTCQPVGLSSDLVVSLVTQPTKRAIRFSGEHLRMREAF